MAARNWLQRCKKPQNRSLASLCDAARRPSMPHVHLGQHGTSPQVSNSVFRARMKAFASWFSAAPSKPVRLLDCRGVALDAFDVRHLLDRDPSAPVGNASRLDRSLDADRYGDLWDAQDREREAEAQRKRRKIQEEEAIAVSAAAATASAAPVPASETVAEAPPPPFDVPYEVPDDMAVPQTEKQHSVIWTLVSFVLRQGPNVVEQVKQRQAGNSLFAFLDPADSLHRYFQFLLRGAEDKSLREAPHLRLWRELPSLGSTGLAALVGSNDAVQKSIVEKLAEFVKQYGNGIVPKVVRATPSPDERRLDFLAPDHPLHEYYTSLLAPPAPAKSEEELAERRRRAAALIQAAGNLNETIG